MAVTIVVERLDTGRMEVNWFDGGGKKRREGGRREEKYISD